MWVGREMVLLEFLGVDRAHGGWMGYALRPLSLGSMLSRAEMRCSVNGASDGVLLRGCGVAGV